MENNMLKNTGNDFFYIGLLLIKKKIYLLYFKQFNMVKRMAQSMTKP